MSEELLFVTVAFGVYVAGVLVFTLLARWSKFVYGTCSAFAGGRDSQVAAALGVVMWPCVLMIGVIFVPVCCVMYFLPEDGGK